MSILGNRPKLPDVTPPAAIEDEIKLKKAHQKDIAKKRRTTGRASTILSEE